jgi:hypothetical protein
MPLDLSHLSRDAKMALYARVAAKEHVRRSNPEEEGSKFSKYKDDPIGFITEAGNEFIWSKQREICEAVLKHDRVAIKSAHEVGKSFILARIIAWFISVFPPGDAFAVTSAPTFPQVRAILWRELNRVHRFYGLPGKMNQTEWNIGEELVAFGRKPDDNAPTAFQGLHALNFLVAFDEGGGIVKNLYDAGESLIANEGGKFVVIGNPDDPNTEFGNICKPGSGWHVITISAFDSPNLTNEKVPDDLRKRLISKGWVEERAKRWGTTSPIYQSKVLGEFPDVSDDTLIEPRFVTAAIEKQLEAKGVSELGVDVARYGRNESVIYHRIGPVVRLHKTTRKRDLMHLCGEICSAVLETGATAVKIDDAGMGGGVTDRLNEIKREDGMSPLRHCEIVPINVGMAATERVVERVEGRMILAKQRFANLKAEITWQLRDLFVNGEIDIGDDEDTQAQLTAIKYNLNSRGLIEIEKKEDMEKRLGGLGGVTGESKSPDRFDGMVLCLADVPRSMALNITGDVLHRSRFSSGTGPQVGITPTTDKPKSNQLFVSEAIIRRSRDRG